MSDDLKARLRGGAAHKPIYERFWWYVTPGREDECWEWQGAASAQRRQNTPRPTIGSQGRSFKASRVSWCLNYGPIPEGMHVLHSCDNSMCVNPNHLFLGTHRDNMKDCAAKNRHRIPNKAPDEARKRAHEMFAEGKSKSEIARELGIARTTVFGIVSGMYP